MIETMHSPGRFIWRETLVPDKEKASRFYGSLFDWTFEDQAMGPGEPYRLITAAGKQVGGIMQRPADMKMPAYWTSYAWVESVDAACAAAKENAGKVMWGPVEIPGAGRMALIAGPDGAMLSVMTPSSSENGPVVPPKLGQFCWETLMAADVASAEAFWRAVVPSWKVSSASGGDVFTVSEGPMGMIADVQKATKGPPAWLTYVFVKSLDATLEKASSLGGKTIVPPIPVPGMGRAAVIADDQGAVIGLFEHTA